MATTTDAILIYGVDMGEQVPWECFDEGDSEEEFEKAKLENPLGYLDFSGETDGGVCIQQHCSDAEPLFIIGIAASRLKANRGYPVEVERYHMDVEPAWKEQLDEFFKKHGIQQPAQPRWWLASLWS